MLSHHNMYHILVTPLVQRFKALDAILGKLEHHCSERNIKDDVFLNDRLYPDMFPFATQVRIATDMTKGAVRRLTDCEVPTFEDNEVNIAELRMRVQALLSFLATLNAAQFEGVEDKAIHLVYPSGKEFHFSGWDYLNDMVISQVYFHLSMAYAILRHRGVALGKADFLKA